QRGRGALGAAQRRSLGRAAMIAGTLQRYFGLRFLAAAIAMFAGMLVLIAMVDFVEMLRRASDLKEGSALLLARITIFRVPFFSERLLPFVVLVAAMSCYLNLSRRHELVIARAAGVSAWQFIAPALILAFLLGAGSTMLYNPVAAA